MFSLLISSNGLQETHDFVEPLGKWDGKVSRKFSSDELKIIEKYCTSQVTRDIGGIYS